MDIVNTTEANAKTQPSLRLKTHIFIWVSLATVLPLIALVFGATLYSEQLYQRDVGRNVIDSLNTMVSEIDRRIFYERQLLLSLVKSGEFKQYLPVMEMASAGDIHPEFFERGDTVNQFLSSFQGVVPGFNAIRILDTEANTLIKVRYGRGSVGAFDGIESFPYVEENISDIVLARRLKELPLDQLSFTLLPHSRWDSLSPRGPALLDAVLPISVQQRVIGYLVASFSGEQMDDILEVAPRVQNGRLLIAELSPDHSERDGLVLFDDNQNVHFTDEGIEASHLESLDGGLLWNAVQKRPDGEFVNSKHGYQIFYMEYFPYVNQLTSWVVASRVDQENVRAPFTRIRKAILAFSVLVIFVSIFLARLGAKKIADPISEMADAIEKYADGDSATRLRALGAEETQQLAASFNYLADTLEQAQRDHLQAQHMLLQSAKLASIGQMAAGIGHELNNPLNNILSLTKLLSRAAYTEDEKIRRDVASLQEEALRASRIIKAILNFARQEAPNYSVFDAQGWLEETRSLVKQAAKEKMISLEARLSDTCVINGDRNQLQQVLVNVFLNAIQASPTGSTIEYSLIADQTQVKIEVVDQGSGMNPDTLDRIFDPFFTTKPVGEGSGLGLSISLGIVEQHGGSLELKNNAPDKGATAIIVLPARM